MKGKVDVSEVGGFAQQPADWTVKWWIALRRIHLAALRVKQVAHYCPCAPLVMQTSKIPQTTDFPMENAQGVHRLDM